LDTITLNKGLPCLKEDAIPGHVTQKAELINETIFLSLLVSPDSTAYEVVPGQMAIEFTCG
jgi:hypothetical protein